VIAVIRLATLVVVALLVSACAASDTLVLTISQPFSYSPLVDSSIERVAIVVTVTNRSDNDILINPGDFWARDQNNRLYAANVVAGVADARLVRLAGGQIGMTGLLPLPAANLRKNDVISGFVVFDVPAGARPTQLLYRETDTDHVVDVPAPR